MTRKQLISAGIILIKVVISAYLIYWISRHIDFRQLGGFILDNATLVVFVAFLSVALWGVEFLRFFMICRRGGIAQPVRPLMKAFFVGFSFRFILPGSQGEIGKMLFIKGTPAQRVSVYLFEKATLIFATLLLLGPAAWFLLPRFRFPAMGISAGLLLVFLGWTNIARWKPVQRYLPSNLSKRRTFLLQVALGMIHLSLVTVQYQIFLSDFGISFLQTGGVVIIVLSALLIPISFAGLGLRESVAFSLLQPLGVPGSVGVGVPLIVFVFNVALPAIIGVSVFLFRRMKVEGRADLDAETSTDSGANFEMVNK